MNYRLILGIVIGGLLGLTLSIVLSKTGCG
jgi:hypothetical protein